MNGAEYMKRFLIILCVLVLALSVAGCGNKNVQIDLSEVKNTIISELEVVDPLDLPLERLQDLYGITPDLVKNSACFITMGGAFPDEIVMVEAVDATAVKTIAEKLEARLADVKNQAQNYDAESFALLEKCEVRTTGSYVTLFISALSSEMQSVFAAATK